MGFSAKTSRALVIFGALVWFGVIADAETDSSNQDSNLAKNLARMNCGAYITQVGPHPRLQSSAVTADNNENLGALLLDDNTVSCPLPRGESCFVITLSGIS